jgi:PAS domain S-box-containing protein
LVDLSVAAPLVQIGLLGEAIDGAPVAVLVADETGRYVAANRYACELFGYPREELLRKRITDLVSEPDIEAHYARFVASGYDEGTVTARRKNGTEFRFRYRAGQTTVAGLPYFVSIGNEVAETA